MRKQAASAMLPTGRSQCFVCATQSRHLHRRRQDSVTPAGLPSGFSFDDPIEYWNSGIDISWEIDVFGGLKHQERSAEARAQAVEEQLHGVRQALAAEVTETYFTIAGIARATRRCRTAGRAAKFPDRRRPRAR